MGARITPQEHQRRLAIHNANPDLLDKDIAKLIGISSNAYHYWLKNNRIRPHRAYLAWRLKNNLPAHKRQCHYNSGVPMAEALTPTQCARMKSFLSSLVATYEYGNQRKQRAPEVMEFIRVWRDMAYITQKEGG